MAERKAHKLDAEMMKIRAEATRPRPAEGWNAEDEQNIREELTRLRAQHSELMRLRNDVTQLRKQLQAGSSATNGVTVAKDSKAEDPDEAPKMEFKEMAVRRMQAANIWGIAFYQYADANGGKLPATVAEASRFISPDLVQALAADGGVSGEGFEIVFQGSINEIENPSEAIIMRDKEPFYRKADGSVQRTYLFADGHTEIHSAADGALEGWEEERRPRLRNARGGN
jgi:prepilin-type processing-associated H-X9-DG protein